MKITTELSPEQAKCLNCLRDADRRTLKAIFRTLHVPTISNLHGEFDAELLDQGKGVGAWFTRRMLNSHGLWVGKAFEPLSETSGKGYTCFQRGEAIVAGLPTRISIGPSLTGDGESMLIDYASTSRGIARWMVDELREYGPGVLLGIGTYGPKIGKRDLWRRKIPFALVGPMRPLQETPVRQIAA